MSRFALSLIGFFYLVPLYDKVKPDAWRDSYVDGKFVRGGGEINKTEEMKNRMSQETRGTRRERGVVTDRETETETETSRDIQTDTER